MSDGAVVPREVVLALEQFGRAALEDRARALDVPPVAIVHQAALYYLAVRGSERAAFRLPRFGRERSEPSYEAVTVTLELEEADWAAFEVEATHQQVPIERLLEHALLLFLADIDSGRVAARIVEEKP